MWNMYKITKYAFSLRVAKIYKKKNNFSTMGLMTYIGSHKIETYNKTCKSYKFSSLLVIININYYELIKAFTDRNIFYLFLRIYRCV